MELLLDAAYDRVVRTLDKSMRPERFPGEIFRAEQISG
jgi:hypothetical protein